jgi:histone-lysine N-methyltransferase SETD2
MSHDTRESKPKAVDTALSHMKLEESEGSASDTMLVEGKTEQMSTPSDSKTSPSPSSSRSGAGTPAVGTPQSEADEHEEVLAGEITLKVEPGKAPKLARKSSQKVIARPPPVFDHLPAATAEAVATFQVIRDCIYGSKYMGASEHDALGCDCSEEWRKSPCLDDVQSRITDNPQVMAEIMRVARTRIALTARPRWNA